jgi:hypothetical protein
MDAITLATTGPWTWGWDSVATIALAVATFLVVVFASRQAAKTAALAKATADDVAGQHRPIITTLPERSATFAADGTVEVHIYNAGPGPALNVNAVLNGLDNQKFEPEEWSKGALPPGIEFPLKFSNVPRPGPQQTFAVDVSYRDVSSRSYTSSIRIRCTDTKPLTANRATLQVVDVPITARPAPEQPRWIIGADARQRARDRARAAERALAL